MKSSNYCVIENNRVSCRPRVSLEGLISYCWFDSSAIKLKMSKHVKKNSGAYQSCVCSSLAKNSKEVDSSESSSLTSVTTSDSDSEGHSTERDSIFKNNKREDKNEKMEIRKKLSKRRNPSEMFAKVLKKLESKKSLKKKVQVPKRDKEFLVSSYLSDSSDDCDCYLYDSYCDCHPDERKNKQKNSKNKREKIKSLKTTKASKKSTTKASKKEKTSSSFKPYSYNCNLRDAKCAGTSKSSRVSKKSTRNAKSLSNKKVLRKCTTESSESSSSFSSSEDSEYESFSNDKDSRDCCCGNIRQSNRKIKY